MPENLPDHPVLLKQLLEQMINQRASDKGKIVARAARTEVVNDCLDR